jgi:hypothetical protein
MRNHPGPYTCLLCEFTIKASNQSSRELLTHWLNAEQEHGPCQEMLFLDESSDTVLNSKGK